MKNNLLKPMRQFYYLLAFLLFTNSFVFGQTCLLEGITFSNQQSIDNFSINYPNCTIIEGDVTIRPSSGISNLEGLRQLEEIKGDLNILLFTDLEQLEGLNSLTTIGGNLRMDLLFDLKGFSGLENLQSIGGSFQFNDNQTFTDFSGLERLKSIGQDFSINDCEALQSLKGLDSLQFIGRSFGIGGENQLDTLSGLGQLRKVVSTININNNKVLKHVDAFHQLDSLKGRLTIQSNRQLETVAGFNNLKFIGGELSIRFNDNLTEIIGLGKLEIVGELGIGANAQLKNLDSFQALTTINSNFSLSNNDRLTNIQGLKSLTTINGILSINSHDSLVNLSGLENLTFIKRFLSIDRNPILENLSALKKLQHISGGLSISFHPRLKTLDGLENIPTTDGALYINDNDSLTNISAIKDLIPSGITELRLRNNLQLDFCAITSICDFLALATNEVIIIENNATNCLDRTTVSNQCEVDFQAPIPSTKAIDWNWTSHLKRTDQSGLAYPTDIFHDSQDNSYVVGLYSSNTFFNDQLLAFSGQPSVANRNSFIAKYDLFGNLVWTKNQNIGSRVISATIDKQDIIHVFAEDSLSLSNTYFYEQYDTAWNQISSKPIATYDISGGAFSRHQIEVDEANNCYFIFRGDGFGVINFAGLADTLKLPKAHNYWLLKYTPEGELAWLDTLQSDGFVNQQMQVAFNNQNELTMAGTYNGNFAAQGKILPGGGGSATHIFCVQYDNQGTIKWAKTFGIGPKNDYCNDLEVNNDEIYLTGTLGFGDYILGEDRISVLRNDPFIFKLNQNGELTDHLILPLNNTNPAKGSSMAFNGTNELVWIGKYAGKNALIGETFLPHEADFVLQENTFLLTIDQSEGLAVESIHTYHANGNYDISELVPLGDSSFLVAGYFSVDITLGDTLFTSDFLVSNRYDAFIGTFGVIDTGMTMEYTPLVVENATWIMLNNEADFTINTSWANKILGDTIIDGIEYKKLYYYECNGGTVDHSDLTLVGVLREDLNARKVYARILNSDLPALDGEIRTCINSEESLLFDFDKTIQQNFEDCHVVAIDESTTIVASAIEYRYGQFRRVFKNEGSIELIEGVGYNSGLFLRPTSSVNAGDGLTGYTQDENFGCEIILSTSQPLTQKVDIFPNPTEDFLSLQFEQVFDGQIQLHSLAGQVLYHTKIQTTHHEITVSDLPKGIYFLHLQTMEGYLVQKIIIQ